MVAMEAIIMAEVTEVAMAGEAALDSVDHSLEVWSADSSAMPYPRATATEGALAVTAVGIISSLSIPIPTTHSRTILIIHTIKKYAEKTIRLPAYFFSVLCGISAKVS